MTEYASRHAVVRKSQAELYMGFCDLRAFLDSLPADKVQEYGIKADYDTLTATVQGFSFGLQVTARDPYSCIALEGEGTPFECRIAFHFDPSDQPGCTDFHIVVMAELNMMMKMMLGRTIQQTVDKISEAVECGAARP